MRVFVYYNLHKKLWSIRALEGPQKGRVIAHSDTVLLKGARGKVSEKGRQRVLREKRKNVHAGITGELVHTEVEGYFPGLAVSYNPYRSGSFYYLDSFGDVPYTGSSFAYMDTKRVYVL